MKQTIQWGIIGCGDVTEVKSGPAFNKVPDSKLVAVMRRDAAKAADYARRHNVPKWYSDAKQLIDDPDVNAIYIATPPSTHEEYTVAALKAGKPVYVEKPMTMDSAAAQRMDAFAKQQNIPLVVAHYRRGQALFKKIRELIHEEAIGEPRFARLELYKKILTKEELAIPKTAWRVDPAIAGGGLFHDLAPHQLDLMYYFFGAVRRADGIGTNQAGAYVADDAVAGTIEFENGVLFSGLWNFSAGAGTEKDYVEIVGTAGKLGFSVFDHVLLTMERDGKTQKFVFDKLEHVQQPMIELVVQYFLGKGANPCTAQDGIAVMQLIDSFTKK